MSLHEELYNIGQQDEIHRQPKAPPYELAWRGGNDVAIKTKFSYKKWGLSDSRHFLFIT